MAEADEVERRLADAAEAMRQREILAGQCDELGRRAYTLGAREALDDVAERLGKASSWSTYDTFLGGGAISSAMKHDRLDTTP
jgi:hypothetical protein